MEKNNCTEEIGDNSNSIETKEKLDNDIGVKFNYLKSLIGEPDKGYVHFSSREKGVDSLGLRIISSNDPSRKYIDKNYKGDIIYYRKHFNNGKGEDIKGENRYYKSGETDPHSVEYDKTFDYNTGTAGVEMTMSYDKKQKRFYYWSAKYTGDARFKEGSPYQLKDIKEFPGSDIDYPVILGPEKAIQIIDRIIKEIEAAKKGEKIESTKVLLSQLKKEQKTNNA